MVAPRNIPQSSLISTASVNKVSDSSINKNINGESSIRSDRSKYNDAIEKAIQKMQSNLVRYARSSDRRMLLRSLRDVKVLQCLLLEVAQPSDGQIFDLEKEVAEESVTINTVPFKPLGRSCCPSKGTVFKSDSCVTLIKSLCSEICNKQGVSASPREVYEKLIVKLARTTSSADPYFRLNSLLGSSDLLVMPLGKDYMTTNAFAMTSYGDPDTEHQPTEMNIYASNGDIHMTMTQTYGFGLFRKSDVKSGRPWIVIQGVVKERANLSKNRSVRQLKVVLPNL